MSITLSSEQQVVLDQILQWLHQKSDQTLTVGGYAGTGKTTLIAELRRALAGDPRFADSQVAFCCYTGKAASVVKQKLQEARAMSAGDTCGTLHSLVYTPRSDESGQIIGWERQQTLAADLIIIDEGSMVTAEIWNDITKFGKRIIVFGDHGQLPPIQGSFSLMASPMILLHTIVRQAEGNPIIALSKEIREGRTIPFGTYGIGVHKYSLQDYDALEYFESIVTSPADDYLCVCGYNKTRVRLNKRIRELRGFESPEPQRGDQVICLKNNRVKHIYNGMRGIISQIDTVDPDWYEVRIAMDDTGKTYQGLIARRQFNRDTTMKPEDEGSTRFEQGRQVGDLFDFGYCLTVHKAQGSEARRVVVFEERMPVYDDQMWRRWLYTAVTRAKEELVMFGRE
jgi:exodeoxyribonuclease V